MISGVAPEASVGGSVADTPGAMLAAARAGRSWSVQQAAEQLHLDPWMIEAMEDNRFLALGAPVYARGHLRKYASVLGLVPDTLIARYDMLSQRPEAPTPKPTIAIQTQRRLKIPASAVIGVVIVIVGVIGVLWWRDHAISVPAPLVTPEVAEGAAVKSSDMPPAAADAPSSPAASASEPATPVSKTSAPKTSAPKTPSPATQPEPVASAADTTVAATPVRMRLTFNEPSWVEIEDARGKRLFFAMGEPGPPRTISGEAPLKVMFGYASAVTLRINERAVSVPARAGVDSARFVVEADGSIR